MIRNISPGAIHMGSPMETFRNTHTIYRTRDMVNTTSEPEGQQNLESNEVSHGTVVFHPAEN